MLNLAVLMGRLVADPVLTNVKGDIAKATFTLAVDRNFTKRGEKPEVDFIDVLAWRSTANFVSNYFHKGQLIAVQGSIQTSTYTDTQGNKRKAFEVVADEVHFADSRPPESTQE